MVELVVHVEFVYIASFSNWSNVVVTNIMRKIYKARRLRRELYSTCIGSIMSVGRGRICGTRRICLHSLVFKLKIVVVANIIPQVDKARRLRRE